MQETTVPHFEDERWRESRSRKMNGNRDVKQHRVQEA